MAAADPATEALIRRRVLRGTVTNYANQLTTFGVWFLLTPFLLRHIGAAGYGLWVLVGSIVGYGALLDLGMGTAVVKYMAEYRARGETDRVRELLATALSLYSLLGLIVIGLAAAVAPFFPDLFNIPPAERRTAAWLVVLMGAGIGISMPASIPVAVLRGLQRFDLDNLVGIGSTLGAAVAIFAALLLGGGVLGMVAASVAVLPAMQVPRIWLIRRIAPELSLGWQGTSRALLRRILSFSSPLLVENVAWRLQVRTDEIVIGAFLPISAVTPYAIARSLGEVPQKLADQFLKVLLPVASELDASNDLERLRGLYITGSRLTLAIFLPVGCLLVLLSRSILTHWLGAAYADYSYLVAILTLATAVDTSQWPIGSVLKGMARHRPLAMMSAFAALANLGLSIALVRRFGLTGVALGTLLPTVVVSLGFVQPYAMRVMGVGTAEVLRRIALPTVLPAVPMVIVVHLAGRLVEPSSALAIALVSVIGLLVYGTGYLCVGASEAEIRAYRGFALGSVRLAGGLLKRGAP